MKNFQPHPQHIALMNRVKAAEKQRVQKARSIIEIVTKFRRETMLWLREYNKQDFSGDENEMYDYAITLSQNSNL